MNVWSQRPQLLHLGLFFAAYVLGCGSAQALAIVPGTGISIWPPSGLFIATLVYASRNSWPWWVLGGLLAELFSNVLWFQNPLPVALLIYTGNALEAMAGAWLVKWACGRPVRLETLQEVLALVVLGAGVAPVASATVGSATLAWFGMQTFATAWPLFWLGDATGVLLVAPLSLVVFQNWHSRVQLSAAQWLEACVLGLIFLGVAALSLSGHLVSTYIVLPPLLWAAVRFQFKGAAAALILLAVITLVFTVSGTSQFVGDPESQKQKQVMLQLFLTISAFSVLIVAAISQQNQQALLTARRSERQLQQLIDAVPALIWCTTPEGIPCYLSKRTTEVTGLTLKDLIASDGSRDLTAVVHPENLDAMDAVFTRSFETGAPFLWRYRQCRANGPHRWVESRAEPLHDESGAIVQWYGVSVDIEDAMVAQEALRDREQELSQLVDMIPSHVWRLKPDGEPTFFNKRMVDFLGLDVADMDKPGMSRLEAVIEACIHPDDAAGLRHAISRSLATGAHFSMRYRLRRTDGVYHWMSSRAEPLRGQDGRIVQWFGLCHDIDDQVHAEEALRRSERQLKQMIDTLPVRIWSATPEGEPLYFNKRYQDHFQALIPNFDPLHAPPIENLVRELAHPEDAPGVQRTLWSCFEAGSASTIRFRWREKDGAYRWAECRVEPRRDQDGSISEWYGVSLDIDEEVRAQEALYERERELSLLVDMVPVYIRRLTPAGEPIFFNKRLTDFIGVSLAEIGAAGTSRLEPAVENFVHPDEATKVVAALRHAIATGEDYTMRYRMRGVDGVYRWVETRAEPVRNQDGTIAQWYSVSIDIEDEVRAQHAEEALRETSDKLAKATQAASLAELSASIAHEVNQPLAAVVANSHACQRWLTAEPPNLERAQKTVQRIIRDANSAADVVGRIRALFKQSIEVRSSTALSSVIAEALDLFAEEAARRGVRLDVDIKSDLPPVALDPIQIQQVLVNLIRNGMEAMDSVADDRVLRLHVHLAGDAVRTEISDRGAGVETPDKVFEPFFTTKEQGMGMGLAISRSIIESHGGRLWAEKNETQGATFIFTLPVEVKAAA